MQLTPRKREILRLVIEEYVASGQPVGSRALVERSGLGFSASTVRGELAELETLGLLTHPHTSAGRTPTESGYRLYAEELVDTLEGRPEALGVDLRSMRDEIELALRATTEMLSDATRLLALVSAPSLETASIRHIEVLTLQPTSVMVVVITSTGGVTKQVFRLDGAGRSRSRRLGGRVPRGADRRASGSGRATVRRRLEAPELAPRERAFLALIGQTLLEVGAEAGPEVFVGGTAGLVGGARVEEVEATMRLVELLERRAAVLELLSEALEPQRPVVHVGPGGRPERSCTPSRSSARRTGSARRRSEPSGSSARCAWTTRRRSAPCAPPRSSSRDSSKTCTRTRSRRWPTTESDYYELLGVPRTASDAEIKRAFRTLARELHPDVSSEPDADARFRDVAEAYEVLSDPERRATYDRYGKAGLRRGGFEPHFTDFGSLSDIFAAFFGEDLLGGGARQRPAARGRRRRPSSRSTSRRRSPVPRSPSRSTSPFRASTATRRAPSPGRRPAAVRRAPEPASCGVSRRTSSASSSSSGRAPSARASGRSSSSRAPTADGDGRVVRGRSSRSTCLRGSTTASRSASPVRGTPGSGAPIADTRSSSCGCGPIRASSATATICTRRSGSTMTEAALGTTATVSSLSGEVPLDVPPGTQPGEVRVLRGEGMPALRGSGRGSLYVRLDVAVPTVLDEEQRALVEQLDEKLDDDAYRSRDEDGGFFSRLKSALR